MPCLNAPSAPRSQHVPSPGGLHPCGSPGRLMASRDPPARATCPFCTPAQGKPGHGQRPRLCFPRSPESHLDSTAESPTHAGPTATNKRGCPTPYSLSGYAASTTGHLATSSQCDQIHTGASTEEHQVEVRPGPRYFLVPVSITAARSSGNRLGLQLRPPQHLPSSNLLTQEPPLPL